MKEVLLPAKAERGKIFNIHYRNINGGLMNFQEVGCTSCIIILTTNRGDQCHHAGG